MGIDPACASGNAFDPVLQAAAAQVSQGAPEPEVKAFFDPATNTISYVAHDPATGRAAIIDSVLDFDPAAGRIRTTSADLIIDHVRARGLRIEWLLETHAHADHLSAAAYLKAKLGGQIAIGRDTVKTQRTFAKIFNCLEGEGAADFDRLFADGDRCDIGEVPGLVLQVPGHTPADVAYVLGGVAFVGDTIFMPDFGTARADFPGGDAHQLYRSIRRLLSLPGPTRLFLCHDYKSPRRDVFAWETTVAEERAHNLHVSDGVTEDQFVALRQKRDAGLPAPRLLLPAIQVNMRAGNLPRPESNGTAYLRTPLNAL